MKIAKFFAGIFGAIGTLLLMLPFARAGEGRADFVTALFTATSATCVTGLSVVDTATYWSTAGRWIILALIQVGGLGVIENDFHDRPDLTPNVCAVYTEESCRCRGIAGKLLNMAVEDLRAKGISPAYLVTDHTDFYERYGWEFLCMVQGDGEPDMTRMYIHR